MKEMGRSVVFLVCYHVRSLPLMLRRGDCVLFGA